MQTPAWILCGWWLSVASTASEDNPGPAPAPEMAGIRLEQLTFLGYDCADGCRRHKAGFAWAEARGIVDGEACTGDDLPSIEGCRAYADTAQSPRESGYWWAMENEIGDARRCEGAGASFAEGCVDYVSADAGLECCEDCRDRAQPYRGQRGPGNPTDPTTGT